MIMVYVNVHDLDNPSKNHFHVLAHELFHFLSLVCWFSSTNNYFPIFLFPSRKNQLPDQKDIIRDIQRLLEGSLQETVNSSEKKVKEIKGEIENIIKSNVPEVKMAINKVGQAMLNISNTLTKQIDTVSDVAGNNSYRHFDTANDYIAQYSVYRYYGGLIVSSVLLIVLVFITFGLLCGICGKRPDGYGDDCCTKGAGARFMMW